MPREPIVLDPDEDPPTDTSLQLEPGTPVKFAGLKLAQFNGQVAQVLRFLPDRERYEVQLNTSNELKTVQRANLQLLPVMDEVRMWSELISRPGVTSAEARPALARLQKLEVTADVLAKTRVGKVVNDASKRLVEADVASEAKLLVGKWRAVFYREQTTARAQLASASSGPDGTAAKPLSSTRPDAWVGATAEEASLAAADRCLARVKGGADIKPWQCRAKRKPSKFLCGMHQRILDDAGKLPHGWINAETPATTTEEVSKDAPRPSVEIRIHAENNNTKVSEREPMKVPEDAPKLLDAMKNAPSDKLRIGLVMALDQSPRSCMPQFVSAGGLTVLEKWLCTGEDSLRFACLTVLIKLPITTLDLQQGHLVRVVQSMEQRDTTPEHRQKAASVMDHWIAEGLLPKRELQEPVQKRPRLVHPTASFPPVVEHREKPQKPPPTLISPPIDIEHPDDKPFPPELLDVDPQIAQLLLKKPIIYEFLKKHDSVLQNLSPEGIAYLTCNLEKAKDTQHYSGAEDASSGCKITVFNLPREALEQDVSYFFTAAGFDPQQVSLPRESRKQRSCGVAFVAFGTREVARAAVKRLNGTVLLNHPLSIELLEGDCTPAPVNEDEPPRVSWKPPEELWKEAVFLKDESVEDFVIQMKRGTPHQAPRTQPQAHARFQAAVGAERAAEARLVREALAPSK